MANSPRFASFAEFYPFYLKEHSRKGTRILHFVASGLAIGFAFLSLWHRSALYVPLGFLVCYGLAWVSHFFVERNRPATFQYPLYSFVADFRLFFDLLTGRQRF